MLDLNRLLRIKLQTYPKTQKFIAQALLRPNYTFPPRVVLRIENEDRIPEHPVMFAMNHTDRYNYWPFQYHRYRCHNRFTATWVKGKYRGGLSKSTRPPDTAFIPIASASERSRVSTAQNPRTR